MKSILSRHEKNDVSRLEEAAGEIHAINQKKKYLSISPNRKHSFMSEDENQEKKTAHETQQKICYKVLYFVG